MVFEAPSEGTRTGDVQRVDTVLAVRYLPDYHLDGFMHYWIMLSCAEECRIGFRQRRKPVLRGQKRVVRADSVSQMIDEHEPDIHVAATQGVHHGISEQVCFVGVGHELIVALQHCAAHVVLDELPSLCAVVVPVFVLGIVFDYAFNGHRHVGGQHVVLVCLVDEVGDKLLFSDHTSRHCLIADRHLSDVAHLDPDSLVCFGSHEQAVRCLTWRVHGTVDEEADQEAVQQVHLISKKSEAVAMSKLNSIYCRSVGTETQRCVCSTISDLVDV